MQSTAIADYFEWRTLKQDLQLAALFTDKDSFLFLLNGFKRHLLNHDEMYRCTPGELRTLDTISVDAALCSSWRLWSQVQKVVQWMHDYHQSVYQVAQNRPISSLRYPLVRGSMYTPIDSTTSMYRVQ
jgi:hypothetical protein